MSSQFYMSYDENKNFVRNRENLELIYNVFNTYCDK